ncbi:MAG: GWxTD domain-containing protein [candidate division KSB1 bacterium]|nr:GWxTD domain-containing protein [candidate division KSB1 bacterium]
MVRCISFLAVIFVMASFVLPVQAHKTLRANLDWAVFQSGDQPVLEFYYSFPKQDLSYVSTEDSFQGLFLGTLQFYQDDSLIQKFAWKNQSIIADTNAILNSELLVDQLRFQLDPGDYTGKFILQDLHHHEHVDSLQFGVNIEETIPGFSISDLELSSLIKRSEEHSPFYKNTLSVTPHPSLIYNESVPMLFFYSELYNLPDAVQNDYEIRHKVLDKNGKALNKIKPVIKKREKAVNPQVEYGFINVGKLTSGIYQLVLEVGTDDSLIGRQTKEFYVYQINEGQQPIVDQSMQMSRFATMDSVLIEKEFDYILYLLNKESRVTWKQIDDIDLKRTFLFNFWKANDPVADTPENEFRDQYLERIRYANEHFRAFKKPGWKTDRGRVLAVYGMPNEIDRTPNEANRAPYERWAYHELQNGVVFIFSDLQGNNDYELLHSELDGEIYNPNYMSIIEKGSY